METRLAHPLWTHLPAAGALVVLIVYIAMAGPLPAEAPVHFGFSGVPDSYGSPWLAFGLTIGLSVFYILLSVFLDELWARQEKAKTFNWLSLLDEAVVGVLVGVSLGYLVFLNTGARLFSFSWQYVLEGGVCVGLAVILEAARPFRAQPQQLVAGDTRALEGKLAKRLRDNTPFVYWESQNPLYVTLLTVVIPLVMFVAAVFSWFNQAWVFLLLLVLGILFIIPYGGQRTLVTRQDITVRFGILGIRVLRLKTAEIAGAELYEFAPLRDFGGYGIRFNREMKAYFLRGTRGVKLTTTGGKKYLIGSDHPEHLSAIIKATAGMDK